MYSGPRARRHRSGLWASAAQIPGSSYADMPGDLSREPRSVAQGLTKRGLAD